MSQLWLDYLFGVDGSLQSLPKYRHQCAHVGVADVVLIPVDQDVANHRWAGAVHAELVAEVQDFHSRFQFGSGLGGIALFVGALLRERAGLRVVNVLLHAVPGVGIFRRPRSINDCVNRLSGVLEFSSGGG